MRRFHFEHLLQLGLFAALTACSDLESPPRICQPGEVWSCSCSASSTGQRKCLDDGREFSECDCPSRPPGSMRPALMQAGSSAGPSRSPSSPAGRDGSSGEGGRAPSEPPTAGTPPSGAAGAPSGEPKPPPAPPPDGAAGSAAPPADPKPEIEFEPTEDDAAYVFDQTVVRTYNIVVAPADLARIDLQPSLETWVPASLEFEGASYGPFMMRYKGSGGSFKWPCTKNAKNDPKEGKCSIKLGFDEVDPELRFYGLKKLNFHATIQDESQLRDRLGYSLFRDSRVAASRAMHARVFVNGAPEGLFVAVEQIDGRFSRARFGEGGEGNVYKEAWAVMEDEAKYIKALESNSDMPNVQGMLAFQAAVLTSAAETERFIDKDYLMRLVAVDRVIMNDDGMFHFYCDINSPNYPGTSHNFYVYESSARDRIWYIPWDLDLSFDLSPWVHVNPAWYEPAPCVCTPYEMYGHMTPPSCDPFVKHMIGWRDIYEREVDAFLAGPLSEAQVEAKLKPWIDQMRPHIREFAGVKRAPTEAEWDTAVQELRAKIASARQHRGYPY